MTSSPPPATAVHTAGPPPIRRRADIHRPRGRLDTLDGIRTIAVMLVLAFHVSMPGMQAGFLGVDVFFVLSGYLITTLLIRELDRTGRISLGRFWARRVLRLMPASLLVIAVVIAWGVLFAPAYQRPGLGQDALWSLLYVANWRFISSSSYFASDGTQSPLQHVWSLAVEEQFYVGWPVLLVLASWLLLRRRGSVPQAAVTSSGHPAGGSDATITAAHQEHDQQPLRPELWTRRIAVLVGVLAAVQIVASATAIWALYDPAAPDRAYMGTDAKAFEPLIGAFAAAAMQLPRVRRLVFRYAELLMLVGLLGIGAGLVWLADENGPSALYFHGGAFAFAVLCALLIVGAAHTRDDFGIGRMLAWSPMAYLGRISYGIYLWHWPLAVWLETHAQWRPDRAVLVVSATIALAALSYHLYEHPIRTGAPARVRPWKVLTSGTAAIAVVVMGSGLLGGTPVSAVVPAVQTGSERETYVLVGDSVARRLVPALAQEGTSRDITVLNAARGGCPALGVNVVGEDGQLVNDVDCATEVPKAQREMIEQTHPTAVLWWSRYELSDRQGPDGAVLKAGTAAFWEAQRAALKTTVDRLATTGATVVIVQVDRIGLGVNSRCTPTSCPAFLRTLRDHDDLRRTWNQMLHEYAQGDQRVRLVAIDDAFCRDAANPCDDRLPLRAVHADAAAESGAGYARPDGSHFSPEVSAALAGELLDRVRLVLR